MIGVFDSGIGGLSVLLRIRELLPRADLIYIADQARAPYGHRSLDEVKGYSLDIAGHLIERGAEVMVVACNTASAAALHELRRIHPDIPFVGMEPAVKPAAASSRSGTIGVLATAATFQGELFASVVDRYARGVRVVAQACTGWVELVEAGVVHGPEAEAAIRSHLEPVVDQGADTLVLGCTHFPFLRDEIQAVAGADVDIVDPSEAVARRVADIAGSAADGSGTLSLITTGDPGLFGRRVSALTGLSVPTQAW